MNEQPGKTIAEFFAGIGLVRIGLENAGWRIAFANDIDEDKWQLAKSQTGRAMLGAAQHRQAGADMTMREP